MTGLNVQFLQCGTANLRDSGFPVRYLSDFHTLHLHQYHGTLRLGDQVHSLSPGVVTLTPAGVPSHYDLPRPGKHVFLHFQTDDSAVFSGGHIPDPDGFYSRQITRVLNYSRSSPCGNWLVGAMQAAIEEMVCRHFAERAGRSLTEAEDCVAKAHALLEDRFAESVYIPEFARIVGMSPNYLAKLFRERYGKTMKRRLLEIRLDRARYLLQNTDLLISQVGVRSGIPDPQYFNKLFRREEGRSPSRFRDGVQ
jgi:AraC-like DNA-binding protein